MITLRLKSMQQDRMWWVSAAGGRGIDIKKKALRDIDVVVKRWYIYWGGGKSDIKTDAADAGRHQSQLGTISKFPFVR